MRRRMYVLLILVASLTVGAVAIGTTAGASGGGGCGEQVTDRRSATVGIRNYCFGPTVTRVDVGDTVTFVNRDSFGHTVLGANASWGSFRQLRGGHRAAYRFARPGIYPYVCTYHPGMVGAVVVGRGVGHTPGGTSTADGPVVPVDVRQAQAAVEPVAAAPDASASTSAVSWPAAIGTAIALAMLMFGMGAIANRRHRRTIAA